MEPNGTGVIGGKDVYYWVYNAPASGGGPYSYGVHLVNGTANGQAYGAIPAAFWMLMVNGWDAQHFANVQVSPKPPASTWDVPALCANAPSTCDMDAEAAFMRFHSPPRSIEQK